MPAGRTNESKTDEAGEETSCYIEQSKRERLRSKKNSIIVQMIIGFFFFSVLFSPQFLNEKKKK